MSVQERDDQNKIHPCIVPFDKLTVHERQYNLSLAQEMLRYQLYRSLKRSIDQSIKFALLETL